MQGILLGFCSFLLIGVFHPIVIKAEYYFTKRIYPFFVLAGIVCLIAAYRLEYPFGSALLGIAGFSCFWSVKELFEQEKRVEKGWFPQNPKRKGKISENNNLSLAGRYGKKENTVD